MALIVLYNHVIPPASTMETFMLSTAHQPRPQHLQLVSTIKYWYRHVTIYGNFIAAHVYQLILVLCNPVCGNNGDISFVSLLVYMLCTSSCHLLQKQRPESFLFSLYIMHVLNKSTSTHLHDGMITH